MKIRKERGVKADEDFHQPFISPFYRTALKVYYLYQLIDYHEKCIKYHETRSNELEKEMKFDILIKLEIMCLCKR